MFEIEYKGENSIVITTKKAKLITNPRLSIVGLKDVKTDDAVVLATTPDMMLSTGEPALRIDGPGEYETADFSIKAIAADVHGSAAGSRGTTVYRIEIGDTRIVVLGNVRAELSELQLESLGMVDIVVVPVGGGGTLNATEAAHLVRAIEAKVVIPVHYADPAIKYTEPQDELSTFKQEFGGELEQTSKYRVKGASSVPVVPTVIELVRS